MRRHSMILALAMCLALPGCLAGPHQLERSVADFDQEIYGDSPWLNFVLWVVPVFPILWVGAKAGDFLVTDAYAFWVEDAWAGDGGTGFKHLNAQSQKSVQSLMREDSEWLRIDRGQ